ncbi:acyl-CoA dehydrogenase family protein [Balneatrix alpica]|uniref:Acyl-CoA dehydrogenase family protein n=1 Tax=Balneatrix alpica TaxID=75684 RepID=A0ABV5Z8J0_9GAMM|nr:acyl-CoA dehydrogenase family protein [Balneatrix alpica]
MSYQAPVQDMQFVLDELVGMAEISQLPGYEEATPDLLQAVLEEAARLAAEVLAPLNRVGDQQGAKLENAEVKTAEGFAQAYQQLVEGGWTSLAASPEYGGQGLPEVLALAVQEMWHSANMGFALCPMLTQGAIEALSSHATAELKEAYLAKLISGEWTGTMNLTEPQAGSDLALLRAKAEPQGDHYLIKGQKIFITWGEHDCAENIIHLVLARLPDAPEGVKGISLFAVPKYLVNADGSLGQRNDLQATALEHKLGIHGSPTCVMSFGDQAGAVGYLIGQPHQGLVCMFTMMNHARLSVGLQGVAIGERAYQQAVAYARERVQGVPVGQRERGAILAHPDVQRMLLSMRVINEAGRALAYQCAAAMDRAHKGDESQRSFWQARAALLTPIVKGWCTELAQEVTSLGVQVHGGMGYIEETGAAQHYRDARILAIYEGTNGIQALDMIGRKTLFDKGQAVSQWLDEVADVVRQLSEVPALQLLAERLQTAEQQGRQSLAWVLEQGSDQQAMAAVAYPYMMQLSTLAGGWQMGLAALKAWPKREQGSFYQAKLVSSQFYMEQVLPRAQAYAQTVAAGGLALAGFAADWY